MSQNNRDTEYDIAVVGGGIAASALLFQMSLMPQFKTKKILNIAHSAFCPPCSDSSTATVCADGLGHLLPAAYQLFSQYFEQYWRSEALCGVELAQKKIILAMDKQDEKNRLLIKKLEKRYGQIGSDQQELIVPAFILTPQQYLPFLQQLAQRSLLELDKKEGFVVNITNKDFNTVIETLDGKKIKAKSIILCSGHGANLTIGLNASLDQAKPIAGHYRCYKLLNANKQRASGEWEIKTDNNDLKIIYRQASGEILLGTHSQKNNIQSFRYDWWEKEKAQFQKWLPQLLGIEFQQLQLLSSSVGVRMRGKKMQPYWGAVGQERSGLYAINNLYKNGYSYAFLAAREICSLIT